VDRMPPAQKKERKEKQMKKEEGEEEESEAPSLFAKKLASLKELKRKCESVRAERIPKEQKVYNLETSFLTDFKDYQDAAVLAGLLKEEDKTEDIGRIFSMTSSTWMEALKNTPELANGSIEWEEAGESKEESASKSHKKSTDKSRKRKK
ncbi:hypothetical protein PMAYCL1PPCAC_02931, partial [Pristionchus mayeri]